MNSDKTRPDRLSIDKKLDRDRYDTLKKEMSGIQQLTEAKSLFFFALAHGFNNKSRIPLSSKEGFLLNDRLQPKDEALMQSVAIFEQNMFDVVNDWALIYQIVEEYAHGGIILLNEELSNKQPGSFFKKYEKTVFSLLKEDKE
jgi:hypothetical protein